VSISILISGPNSDFRHKAHDTGYRRHCVDDGVVVEEVPRKGVQGKGVQGKGVQGKGVQGKGVQGKASRARASRARNNKPTMKSMVRESRQRCERA